MVKIATTALVFVLSAFGLTVRGGETVLLDFTSPKCPPCRQMEPTIHSMQSVGYPIRTIDVTREPQLADQHSVRNVPSFVMLVDGREVDRVVGATSRERLESMFQRARDELARQNTDRIRAQSPDSDQPLSPQSASPYADGRNAPPPADQLDRSVPSADRPQEHDPQYARLIDATVRLRVEDGSGRSFGTGTIIDARSGEALVITCGHLFRQSEGKGPVTVELFEVTPTGARPAGKVAGTVISYDLDRDLGLVTIRPDRPVTVAPLAPRRTVVERGDRVVGVGCSNGDNPTVLTTRVTAVDRYQGPPNLQAAGAPVVGRSGGGLFNEQGELVGVCFAADYEGNEGLYASLDSIHSELDRVGLSEIVGAPEDARAEGGLVAVVAPTDEPLIRGQAPLQDVMPVADSRSVGPNPASDELDAVEQAALEEILTRAAECEVVCIIRPKEPGGQSEVITLDRVSPSFVRALTAARGDAQTPVTR